MKITKPYSKGGDIQVNKLIKFLKTDKHFSISLLIAVVVILGILIGIKDEITRFTLAMPVFAGWILYNILMLEDEDEPKKKPAKKKAKK